MDSASAELLGRGGGQQVKRLGPGAHRGSVPPFGLSSVSRAGDSRGHFGDDLSLA